MSIQRERRRLGRAFQAALLAAGSPAIVLACSTSGPAQPGAEAGAPDATLDSFVPSGGDAEAGSSTDGGPAPTDAAIADTSKPAPPSPFDAACYTGAYELDAGPDADSGTDICAYTYACDFASTGLGTSGCNVLQVLPDGTLAPIPQTTCWIPQEAGCDDDVFAPEDGGSVTVECTPCPSGGGRRPVGLQASRRAPARGLAGYLASMAFEEDASVAAFAQMQAELAALGAPAALVSAAARAESDEVRHQRAMARLSLARGGRERDVARARVRRPKGRRAAAVAAENAAEGCVRETYGALLARWQSVHAEDAGVRRAFERIAADEARHAALSWAVAHWIEPTLDAAGRRRVSRARTSALRALRASVAVEPSPDVARAAGLPSAAEARALLDALARDLPLTPAARRSSPPP